MMTNTIIITGASGAIGGAIALGAAKSGFDSIHVIGRNEAKLITLKKQIEAAHPMVRIHIWVMDLSQKKHILSMRKQWEGPLTCLVNNAAIAPPRRMETPEGIEMQFATNVLSYYWMAQVFENALTQAKEPRVVNVASYWAGDVDLNDLQFNQRSYDNNTAYRQSKALDRMLTKALANHWQSLGIMVNSCHPGDVNSRLSNDLGFGGHESPDQGAATPLYLATMPYNPKMTGLYMEQNQKKNCPFSQKTSDVEQLWDYCLTF